MKPKVSVIVPYMEADSDKRTVLKRLTDSLVGYDELIIVSNWKWGYAKPINLGLSIAKGDFLMILNDDLKMDRGGDLHDICDTNFVTSPTLDGNEQPFWGCAFMIPRWVYETVGGLDEGYEISYYDDDSFKCMLLEKGIPMKCVPLVNFWNVDGGGRTLHTFPNHNEFSERNKKRFISIWGYEPPVIYDFYDKYHRLPKKGEILV